MNSTATIKKNLQDFAKKQLEQIKDFYIKSPSLMLEHYELERKTSEEYNGRQLLELIQNADDAANNTDNAKALIYLTKNILIIANNGEPFTEGGLDSILHSNLSPKFNEKKQIGNKGLGFRAILSWAKSIKIKSGDLKIGFSKEYSNAVLKELITKNSDIRTRIEKRYNKEQQSIAVLRCPEILESIQMPDVCNEYDTAIIIELKENILGQVEHQLTQTVDAEMMLFLNNLNYIEIHTSNLVEIINREWINNSRIKIEVKRKGKLTEIQEWNLHRKNGIRPVTEKNPEEKNYEVCVAWKDDLSESKNVLHSFFKTNVPFKFPGILHATFELSANRNELIDDTEEHNNFLFGVIITTICEASIAIAQRNLGKVNYLGMQLGMIDFSGLNVLMKEAQFEIKFKNAFRESKIFPTIDNKYINWEDEPVYYDEPEFAQFLSPTQFPDLLLCCDTEVEEKFLKTLEPTTYKIDDIIKDIAERRKELSVKEYATFIIVLSAHIANRESKEMLPSLFYGNDNRLLDFDKPIFLPSINKSYDLPPEMGVQIIESVLAKELTDQLKEKGVTKCSEGLSAYSIMDFQFNEIADAVISYYGRKNTVLSIRKLNEVLFNLYQNEVGTNSWDGLSVPLICVSNKIAIASELYFGKDYDNSLIEHLYNYNKSKIVASPEKYEIDDANKEKWKKYLKWLGVAELPRRLQITITSNEYADYCMRSYNYKNKVAEYSFKNYKAFKYKLSKYVEARVETRDGLEEILKNAQAEYVLVWLQADSQLVASLESDSEVFTSSIELHFSGNWYHKSVRGSLLKNYMQWLFGKTQWITTESGIVQRPLLCTTAATITIEFSPLLEKPLLQYDLLKQLGVNKDKAEYLLHLVGVHKTISSLSTDTLYSLLMQLPNLDGKGAKAKSLYRELAVNYDEKHIDKEEENYIRFKQNGQVLCSYDGNHSYLPISQVYYVDNKRYGERIISQFPSIEIDRRRGRAKIQSIFGVKPLENIKLSLSKTPEIHILSSRAEQELENFKPYVYVFRQEADVRGTEKNIIKDIKFRLVKELTVITTTEKGEVSIDLHDFEYFYHKDKSLIYIKTPDFITSEQELKSEVNFCAVIAEAFSSILDVDANRQQIRELFSKTQAGRDDIIRNELDDINLEKLTAARFRLGVVSDPKVNFWASFSKCFKNVQLNLEKNTDDQLKQELLNKFIHLSKEINEGYDKINYSDYNQPESARLVIMLLQKSNLSLEDINKYLYPSFDIRFLYDEYFFEHQRGMLSSFKHLFYEKCIFENQLRVSFKQTMEEYEGLIPSVISDINFDVERDFKLEIYKRFKIDLVKVNSVKDYSMVYFNNKTNFIAKSAKYNIESRLVEQFINESLAAQSLLYFGEEVEELLSSLNNWLSAGNDGKKAEIIATKDNKIVFNGSAIFYNSLADLKNQLDEKMGESEFEKNQLRLLSIQKSNESKGNSTTSIKKNVTKTTSWKQKEDVGFLGEYLVYKYLLKTIKKKDSVKWVSEYAKLCGVNDEGRDGLGYDMVYIPDGHTNEKFIEVKVVGWQNSFYISSTEVAFGERNKKKYEVFLVRNIEHSSELTFERIVDLFDYKGKSFTDNDLFSVINDNFIIKFKKIK